MDEPGRAERRQNDPEYNVDVQPGREMGDLGPVAGAIRVRTSFERLAARLRPIVRAAAGKREKIVSTIKKKNNYYYIYIRSSISENIDG